MAENFKKEMVSASSAIISTICPFSNNTLHADAALPRARQGLLRESARVN
ncbi:hypothetical protein [Rhizobium sp. YTU87027]